MTEKNKSIIAILLIAFLPSIGVGMGMFLFPGPVGTILWSMLKILLVLLPLFWTWKIENHSLKIRFPESGIGIGIIIGFATFVLMWCVYLLFGLKTVDPLPIRAFLEKAGMKTPYQYGVMVLYWTFINSFIEEAIFRSFMVRHLKNIFSIKHAILLSALIFTLHHSIVMIRYFAYWQNLLGSLGIFLSGVIWSILYTRHKSLIPPYIAHILADLGLFTIGAHILYFLNL